MLHFATWKVALIAVVCALGIAFGIPNFMSRQMAESPADLAAPQTGQPGP